MNKSEKIERLEAKIVVLTESLKDVKYRIETLKTFYNYLQVRAWRKHAQKLNRLLRYTQQTINELKSETPRNNAKEILKDETEN